MQQARKGRGRMKKGKSPERITSQEELHDYMRVTSPALWLILGVITVALTVFIVFAATATMENTMPIQVDVQQPDAGEELVSIVTSELPASMAGVVRSDMRVRIGQFEGMVDVIMEDADGITLMMDMDNDIVPLPEGVYDAVLVLESTTPIRFLWN